MTLSVNMMLMLCLTEMLCYCGMKVLARNKAWWIFLFSKKFISRFFYLLELVQKVAPPLPRRLSCRCLATCKFRKKNSL